MLEGYCNEDSYAIAASTGAACASAKTTADCIPIGNAG
jgi:hypothetical protein